MEALYVDNIMTRLYEHVDYAVKANVDRFRDIVRRTVETTGKRVIKVLEVGAGTLHWYCNTYRCFLLGAFRDRCINQRSQRRNAGHAFYDHRVRCY